MFYSTVCNLSYSLLEDGCSQKSFDALIGLLRYFEYEGIATAIVANSTEQNQKYHCPKHKLQKIFDYYR